MNESQIVLLGVVSITSMTLIAFVAIVVVLFYFTDKRVSATISAKAEKGALETRANLETDKKVQKN